MKKIIFIGLCLIFSLQAFAQLGKSKQELLGQYGKDRVLKESEGKPGYSGLLIRVDSVQFMQATFKGDKAVMLSYVQADSMLNEQQYKKYLNQSLPGFTPQRTCALGSKTYLLDARKNQLVVQTHKNEGGGFPLTGLILVNDPSIIKSMADRIKQICQ